MLAGDALSNTLGGASGPVGTLCSLESRGTMSPLGSLVLPKVRGVLPTSTWLQAACRLSFPLTSAWRWTSRTCNQIQRSRLQTQLSQIVPLGFFIHGGEWTG